MVVEYHVFFYQKKHVWVNPPKLCVEGPIPFSSVKESFGFPRCVYI